MEALSTLWVYLMDPDHLAHFLETLLAGGVTAVSAWVAIHVRIAKIDERSKIALHNADRAHERIDMITMRGAR